MRYGATEAVAGIDLRVARGEIFAFLGPNGAGKTTTVEILEGFRERSGATVSVLGVDPSDGGGEWRNRIGAVLLESSAEPGFTVRECLELYAGYYDQPRSIDETIALVGLAAKADARGEAGGLARLARAAPRIRTIRDAWCDCDHDARRGRPPVGVTANSFTSLSLDPPLVRWALQNDAPSRVAFDACIYFGVNA
jgi:energy-coupling factor transporter ATP-binding protein EcfA2